ncbi:MAG: DUF6574 domain-containing protein [Lactobacillus kalixensis]|uniref:DUF6574 domain-containing protein n=1 Tax=Lactobacillus kalixensis TaxID=227944 RepID=UPI0039958FF0
MKTCPNCGFKMEPNVNFCTNCGADLRKVQLDSATQSSHPVESIQSSESVLNSESQVTQKDSVVGSMTRSQYQEDTKEKAQSELKPNLVSEKAVNMWQWFVNSWKKPFAEQSAEKWYGWGTLLVENILLILGLYICINKYTQEQLGNYGDEAGAAVQSTISSFSTSVLFELFLYFVLTIAAMIAAAYYAHKFIYGQTENVFDFINRIVSCGNIAAILYVVSFLCLIIGSEDTLKLGLPLIGIAMLIFTLSVYTVVVGDNAPAVQDKFYGLLIVVIAQTLVIFILGKIFGNAVYNQIQQLVHTSISSLF